MYPFEQPAPLNDATGNRNTGTDVNASNSNATAIVGGKIGDARYFNGNGSIQVANSAMLNPANLTMSCWINRPATQNMANIITKGDQTTASYLLGNNGANSFLFMMRINGAYRSQNTTSTINANTWYQLTGTFDQAAGVKKFYLDGKLCAETPVSVPQITNNLLPLTFGGISTVGFNGILDQVTLSSVARSSDWIKACYENQKDGQRFIKFETMRISEQVAYVESEAVYELENGGLTQKYQNINTPMGTEGRIEFNSDVGNASSGGIGSEVAYYYIKNHLGSTAAVINDKGELIEATMYTAYGEQIPLMVLPGTEAAAREKFTGKEFDTEGGINLDYFGWRYYDPEVGLWTSVEPEQEPQDWGSYTYCADNPTNKTDPNGRWWETGLDITSLGYDYYNYFNNPTLVGAGLVIWDVAAVALPAVPGSWAVHAATAVVSDMAKFAKGAERSAEVVKSAANVGKVAEPAANAEKSYYRYVGEGEAGTIKKTGEIPAVDRAGNAKEIYLTDRRYETAGRAKTHNQLPEKPTHRVEIDPKNVKDNTPFRKIDPTANPQWGKGGGVESTTRQPIKVDPIKIKELKGASF